MLNSISVRKALDEINTKWFLPCAASNPLDINTTEEERKICCMFDSLMRDFPIGIIILLKTRIPHYPFSEQYTYTDDEIRGYDFIAWEGQKILQRLYRGVNTFNGKVLCYDLLHDLNNKNYERYLTGFSFHKKDEKLPWHYIKMKDIMRENYNDMFSYPPNFKNKHNVKDFTQSCLITDNLHKIWETFLNRDRRNLNYFVAYDFADAVDVQFRLSFCTAPIITSVYSKNKKEETFEDLEMEKNYYHHPGIF